MKKELTCRSGPAFSKNIQYVQVLKETCIFSYKPPDFQFFQSLFSLKKMYIVHVIHNIVGNACHVKCFL